MIIPASYCSSYCGLSETALHTLSQEKWNPHSDGLFHFLLGVTHNAAPSIFMKLVVFSESQL